jgi:hypothetical protein
MQGQSMMKSVLSLGNPETNFSSQKFDYSQPFVSLFTFLIFGTAAIVKINSLVNQPSFVFQACVSYPYVVDSYYGGVLTGYASNANVSFLYGLQLYNIYETYAHQHDKLTQQILSICFGLVSDI